MLKTERATAPKSFRVAEIVVQVLLLVRTIDKVERLHMSNVGRISLWLPRWQEAAPRQY